MQRDVKVQVGISYQCFFKLFIFICGFSAKVTCAFKGTVVNQVMPSLHGGSLEITRTASLSFFQPSQI